MTTPELPVETPPRKSAEVDYNNFFVWTNYFFFVATLALYGSSGFPALVNGTTLFLYGLLVAQVQIFLFFERKQRNAFVLVLVFVLTVFYYLRIFTLAWSDDFYYSGVLNRIRPATVDDVNYTLFFVFFANIAIFMGIVLSRRLVRQRIDAAPKRDSLDIKRAVLLLGLAMAYGFYTAFMSPFLPGIAQRGLGYLSILLDLGGYIPFGVIYLTAADTRVFRIRRVLVRRSALYSFAFILLQVGVAALQLSVGSRSALWSTIQMIFLSMLALGRFSVSRKMVIAAGLVIALSIPLFTIGTLSREIRARQGADLSLSVQRRLLTENIGTLFQGRAPVRLLVPMFDRIGYLDMSVDLIKNAGDYRRVVNVPYYLKSLVDNNTPGFDVFNVPKVANALNYVSNNLPLKRIDDFYQSDQLNVYGEYYDLFGGWLSLPAVFAAAFLLQAIYSRVRGRSALATSIWRYFVISLFFEWLLSFGMDWLFLDATRGFVVWYMLLAIIDRKKVLRFA